MKRWAVVQDFDYYLRVYGRYRYHWRARLRASRYRRWRIIPLGDVAAENARLQTSRPPIRGLAELERRFDAIHRKEDEARNREIADKLIPRFAKDGAPGGDGP